MGQIYGNQLGPLAEYVSSTDAKNDIFKKIGDTAQKVAHQSWDIITSPRAERVYAFASTPVGLTVGTYLFLSRNPLGILLGLVALEAGVGLPIAIDNHYRKRMGLPRSFLCK